MIATVLFLFLAAFAMVATIEYTRTRRGPLILLAVWATHITASYRWLGFALTAAWSLRTRYPEFLQQVQWEVSAPRPHCDHHVTPSVEPEPESLIPKLDLDGL